MCDFCKDTEGNLEKPFINGLVDMNAAKLDVTGWIWNKEKKGGLWLAISLVSDGGYIPLYDEITPIRYCPNCGRNLEV